MRVISIIIIGMLIIGCANKKIVDKNINDNNYEKVYEYYLEYAKRGFPEAAEKIARMIYQRKVNKPPYIERKYALYAYNHGYERAALYIADSYFREKKFEKALEWYNEVDFSEYSDRDFKNYLEVLNSVNDVKKRVRYLKRVERYALKFKKAVLLRLLGKYYLTHSPFYNPEKAIELLQQAYNLGDYKAGVILGIYYIKSDEKYKGYQILKNLLYKDKTAAYYIGDYLYNLMIEKEKLYNNECITCNFKTPKEFFVKKLTIYKFNDLFTRTNIKKAYDISLSLGNVKAIYKLIKLDIEDNTYELANNTYSGMDLNQTEKFLNLKNEVEAKLILATIYEKYPILNKTKKAKEIYEWYKTIDKIQAIWKLYQYEKKFEEKINFNYLNFLVSKKFVPAIIEKAYQEILLSKNIEDNKEILEYYADLDNILALNYMGSLYSKEIFKPKEKSIEYYKKACILENKPFYIPSEDLKIANYYNDVLKDINKTMSIIYYYHQMKNRKAQLKLASFYKQHCNYDKFTLVLKELVKEADKKGTFLYYLSVIKKEIDGDFNEAFEFMKKQDYPLAYVALGDIYARGIGVELDPKIAEKYYKKAIQKGYIEALLNLANMYKRLNIDGIYNEKIISIYQEAINKGLNVAKIELAKFYYSIGEISKAIELLKTVKDPKLVPKARYLYFQYTGRDYFERNEDTNYGFLLLVRAQKSARYNPKKALYYAFRAMLCNTPQSARIAMELMLRINNAKIIEEIYNQAKQAPRCHL